MAKSSEAKRFWIYSQPDHPSRTTSNTISQMVTQRDSSGYIRKKAMQNFTSINERLDFYTPQGSTDQDIIVLNPDFSTFEL